jgi:hypothetical protein
MTVGLATLTVTRGENTGTQVVDSGQTGGDLIAAISECL